LYRTGMRAFASFVFFSSTSFRNFFNGTSIAAFVRRLFTLFLAPARSHSWT
jgi:hypothetical protein